MSAPTLDLLDLLAALDRPPLSEAASGPVCQFIGEHVPEVAAGDVVTLCTASYRWTVTAVYDDGIVALAPARRDKWRMPITAHGQHLERVPSGPHDLVGPRRIRLDIKPHGMRAVQCACGAKPRDEAAHARHAAARLATGCPCTLSCTHPLPKESNAS